MNSCNQEAVAPLEKKELSNRAGVRSSTDANQQGLSDGAYKEKMITAIKSWQNLSKRFVKEEREFYELRSINNGLCKKVNEKRSKCYVDTPIQSNATMDQVSCDGSLGKKVSKKAIQVDFNSSKGGKFKLKIDDKNQLLSDPFQNGVSELKFASLADDSLSVPTFLNISSIRLVPDFLNGKTDVTILIKVDGQIVVQDDITDVESGESYQLSLEKIYQLSLSSSCRTQNDELDYELDQLRANAQNEIDRLKPNPYIIKSDGSDRNLNLEQIEKRLAKLKETFTRLAGPLDQERNRAFKLKNELLHRSNIGCHLKRTVEELRVQIRGKKSDAVAVGTEKKRKQGTGSASVLSVSLGGLAFTVDLTTNNILSGMDYIVEENFENVSIGALDKLEFEKKGTEFDNLEEPCNKDGGIFNQIGQIFDNPTCYNIKENHVMGIDYFKVSANGITLFEEGDLDVMLNYKDLNWSYPASFQSSPFWHEMLLRKDCDVTQ